MLKITCGDDKSFGITFPDGTDLTGCIVFFTVKPEALVDAVDPSDSNAVIKGTASGYYSADQKNRAVMTLSSAVTGAATPRTDCVYSVKLKDSGGKFKTWGKPRKCELVATTGQRTS